jgi:hypothetical protein
MSTTTVKFDLVEKPTVALRFPIRSPIPCPCCGSSAEITSPNECICTHCGATQRKMRNEVERLKAMASPEWSDLYRAAARLIPLSRHQGRYWEELKGPARQELVQGVRLVMKALKER